MFILGGKSPSLLSFVLLSLASQNFLPILVKVRGLSDIDGPCVATHVSTPPNDTL